MAYLLLHWLSSLAMPAYNRSGSCKSRASDLSAMAVVPLKAKCCERCSASHAMQVGLGLSRGGAGGAGRLCICKAAREGSERISQ
eukprot:5039-Heterococcus_DN1.PRE.1